MATLAELQAREAALEAALGSGAAAVFYDGKRVEYRAQSDIKAALAEVRREIRGAQPGGALVFTTSKGLRRSRDRQGGELLQKALPGRSAPSPPARRGGR